MHLQNDPAYTLLYFIIFYYTLLYFHHVWKSNKKCNKQSQNIHNKRPAYHFLHFLNHTPVTYNDLIAFKSNLIELLICVFFAGHKKRKKSREGEKTPEDISEQPLMKT